MTWFGWSFVALTILGMCHSLYKEEKDARMRVGIVIANLLLLAGVLFVGTGHL